MAKLRITQNRAVTDRGKKQRGTARALGLGKIGRTVVHEDKPEIRGMIEALKHLVTVEEIDS